jgi:hypothetical protein
VSRRGRFRPIAAAAGLALLAGLPAAGCRKPEQTQSPPPGPKPEITRIDEPPAVEVRRGAFRFIVLLPDAEKGFYRGVRFDHSGIVAFAQLGGRTFIGRLEPGPDRRPGPVYSLGTCQEYRVLRSGGGRHRFYRSGGLDLADGSAMRIGSRRLTGPRNRTPGDLLPWDVEILPNGVRFQQRFTDPAGWGYHLTKTVAILPDQPGFVISHAFENIGTRPIHRFVYSHNWLCIDGQPPDSRTVLTLGRDARRDAESRPQAVIEGKDVRFTDVLAGTDPPPFHITLPGSWTVRQNVFRLGRTDTGPACEVRGNWAPAFADVYADASAVCPEPHFELSAQPGQTVHWATTYRFFQGR